MTRTKKRDDCPVRPPNSHLTLLFPTARRIPLSSFLTWCDHAVFNRSDGCLVADFSLTERPVCQLVLAESVRKLPGTQIEIRIKKSFKNSIVHHLFQLGLPSTWVSSFYRREKSTSSPLWRTERISNGKGTGY